MTHDTDVLEPEPARQGGLMRRDLVRCHLFSRKLVADLVVSNTPFANQKNLWTPLRREHPL
jgi:hypothetical protein